jgi:hypothetical protein
MEEIEIYERYLAKQKKIASGDYVPEDDEEEIKDPPMAPKLDIESLGKLYDEQYVRFEIPAPVVLDQDTDWRMD